MRELVMRDERVEKARIVDAGGRVVLPGFVDSHSHPVFASPRLDDFEKRLAGATYERIASEGGGILSTVNAVRGSALPALVEGLVARAALFLKCGTTTLEAKSGYGLDLENELKMLRAIRQAGERTPLSFAATFIGAHAVPPELKDRRVCDDMIPAVSREKLAAFADVFCEDGYFTLEDSGRIFEAAARHGLKLKIHSEQLSRGGSVALAVKAGAASCDHLDFANDEDAALLAASGTVACLVPGSNYFIGKPYPAARRLIDAGAAVALATDFNPGTCPCWDMRMILSISCTQMKMSPAETLVAATFNGACALGLQKSVGSLEAGKQADLVCYDAEDYRELPYYFGDSGAHWVMKKGAVVHSAVELTPR